MHYDRPFNGSFPPGDPRHLAWNFHGMAICNVPAWRYVIKATAGTQPYPWLEDPGINVPYAGLNPFTQRPMWYVANPITQVAFCRIERWWVAAEQRIHWYVVHSVKAPYRYWMHPSCSQYKADTEMEPVQTSDEVITCYGSDLATPPTSLPFWCQLYPAVWNDPQGPYPPP